MRSARHGGRVLSGERSEPCDERGMAASSPAGGTWACEGHWRGLKSVPVLLVAVGPAIGVTTRPAVRSVVTRGEDSLRSLTVTKRSHCRFTVWRFEDSLQHLLARCTQRVDEASWYSSFVLESVILIGLLNGLLAPRDSRAPRRGGVRIQGDPKMWSYTATTYRGSVLSVCRA